MCARPASIALASSIAAAVRAASLRRHKVVGIEVLRFEARFEQSDFLHHGDGGLPIFLGLPAHPLAFRRLGEEKAAVFGHLSLDDDCVELVVRSLTDNRLNALV